MEVDNEILLCYATDQHEPSALQKYLNKTSAQRHCQMVLFLIREHLPRYADDTVCSIVSQFIPCTTREIQLVFITSKASVSDLSVNNVSLSADTVVAGRASIGNLDHTIAEIS
jgi:hypothetical protein